MSYMSNFTLNSKMRLFVEAYSGNVVEAMKQAGYDGTDLYLEQRGSELLRQPIIIQAIRERSKHVASTIRIVADRTERQAFYTSIMRNEDPHYKPVVNKDGVTEPEGNIPMGFRLKSAELLSKTEGDFVDRIDIRQQVSITEVINEAYSISDDELDAIEAEYENARLFKEEKKQLTATTAPVKLEDLI